MATESAKQNNDAKSSESADKDVQSTPSTKRVATKRKLIDEADDVQTKDDSKTSKRTKLLMPQNTEYSHQILIKKNAIALFN